jgi:hypothetical protein
VEVARPVKLFRVAEGNRDVWVAALISDRMYVYVDNTGRFHQNAAVSEDYWQDQRLKYEPIGVSQAQALIDQHVGRGDEAQVKDQLDRYRADPDSFAVDAIFAQITGG